MRFEVCIHLGVCGFEEVLRLHTFRWLMVQGLGNVSKEKACMEKVLAVEDISCIEPTHYSFYFFLRTNYFILSLHLD